MSFTKLHYHLVFATKNRRPLIVPQIERSMYMLIFEIAKKYGAKVYRIGGAPDHVHILFSLEPRISVSKFVQALKRETSYSAGHIMSQWDGWQEGYGCFTCSYLELPMLTGYNKKQKTHHEKKSFMEEYREMLIENGVSQDEPYFPK